MSTGVGRGWGSARRLGWGRPGRRAAADPTRAGPRRPPDPRPGGDPPFRAAAALRDRRAAGAPRSARSRRRSARAAARVHRGRRRTARRPEATDDVRAGITGSERAPPASPRARHTQRCGRGQRRSGKDLAEHADLTRSRRRARVRREPRASRTERSGRRSRRRAAGAAKAGQGSWAPCYPGVCKHKPVQAGQAGGTAGPTPRVRSRRGPRSPNRPSYAASFDRPLAAPGARRADAGARPGGRARHRQPLQLAPNLREQARADFVARHRRGQPRGRRDRRGGGPQGRPRTIVNRRQAAGGRRVRDRGHDRHDARRGRPRRAHIS